jgi:hypothetical protein
MEEVLSTIDHSFCFGILMTNKWLCQVITDYVVLLTWDVFITEEHRGKGYFHLVDAMMKEAQLKKS